MKRRERELRAESVLSKGKRGKTEKQGKALRGEREGEKREKKQSCASRMITGLRGEIG